ncbi:MAG: acyl-CoA dehydrogenase family protein [Chloroflexi bacterium]|nr:acyl-CoA dehydrogenase family protein [Chloroflexota bacterium]
MDFVLEQRRELLRNSIREFVKQECPVTLMREIDQKGEWPAILFAGLGELGYLGIPYPEQYGGADGDTFDLALIVEELAYGAYALAVAYRQSVVLGGMSVLYGGTEELKRQLLPEISEGQKILTWALTEADIASDAGHITTSARLEGGSFVIDGAKMFVYAADVADYCTVIARTSGEPGDLNGLTAILVPLKGTTGLSMRPLQKMGLWPVGAFEVVFKGVSVPAANALGGVGGGWDLAQRVLDVESIAAAAASAGVCQRIVDDAKAYAKQRVQFDQPIAKFQAVAHMIADMHVDSEAMKYMAYRAAWMHSKGLECRKEAALAKLYCSEVSQRVATSGIQSHGGYGYMAEFDMERFYRDSRRESLTSGSSIVAHDMIAQLMGLR